MCQINRIQIAVVDTDTEGATEQTVSASIRVVDPSGGNGATGVTVSSEYSEALSDETGVGAVVVLPSTSYEIALSIEGTRTLRVFGIASDTSFEQITYMSPEMITSFVYNSLGLTDDPEKGILVVGLDLPNLAPAVGASAAINLTSDAAFVFAGFSATQTNTIPAGGQGFVTFPNVEPGLAQITVSYPEGACQVFPAEAGALDVPVAAGEVSVIAYTCRAGE